MSKVGSWSTTAGSNNQSPPDGWPEGQPPSSVNNCAREMMAAIRTVFNDVQFFDHNLTPTQTSATTFTVDTNQTSLLHIGRRLKLFDGGTTKYGTITNASFTAVTTVHVSNDGAGLTASLSSFAVAAMSRNSSSFPEGMSISAAAIRVSGNLTVLGNLSASSISGGFGAVSATSIFTSGTLSVSGAAVFTGNLTVHGNLSASSISGGLGAISATSIFTSGTLSVSGAAVFGSSITNSNVTPLILNHTGANANIRRNSGSDIGTALLVDVLGPTSSLARVGFHRNTNTTGNREFVIFRGDGSATIDHTFFGGGGYVAGAPTGGNKGVGTVNAVDLYINDVKAVPETRSVTGGNGMTGGGNLTLNREITMGTPGTLTSSTTNNVTATSHTHAINLVVDTQTGNASGTTNIDLPSMTFSVGDLVYLRHFVSSGATGSAGTDRNIRIFHQSGTARFVRTSGSQKNNTPAVDIVSFSDTTAIADGDGCGALAICVTAGTAVFRGAVSHSIGTRTLTAVQSRL